MIRRQNDQVVQLRYEMLKGMGRIEVYPIFTPENLGGKAKLFARLVIRKGNSIGVHRHTKEREIFLILRGTGVATHDREDAILGPGDAMVISDGMTHSIANLNEEPLEMLAVILPD